MMPAPSKRRDVDATSLPRMVDELCSRSDLIRGIVTRYGPPPPWRREPGFASLVYAILEQQVSLASARAVYERLVGVTGDLTPSRFAKVDTETLRAIGFSRQKIEYCTGLAERITSGQLDLGALEHETDDEVRAALTGVRGIGRWTADIYLLHSLGRPDVWPTGDLALRVAVREELGLRTTPGEAELQTIGDSFRPWRSVAARVFWRGYLARRSRSEGL